MSYYGPAVPNECDPNVIATGDEWVGEWQLTPLLDDLPYTVQPLPIIAMNWRGLGGNPITAMFKDLDEQYKPTYHFLVTDKNGIGREVPGTLEYLGYNADDLVFLFLRFRVKIPGYFDDVVEWMLSIHNCCDTPQFLGDINTPFSSGNLPLTHKWIGYGYANKVGPGPDGCFECHDC